MKLKTTDNQFHDMHVALTKARASTKSIPISRAALTNVLCDHSSMVGALRDEGVELTMEDA